MEKHHDEPGSPAWHARRARCFNAGDAAAMLGCHPSGVTRTQLLHALHTGIEREFSDFVQERVITPGHRVEALWRPIAEAIVGEDLQVYGATLDVGLSRPLGASLDAATFLDDTLGECKSANDALRAALPHTGRDSHERNDARQLPKGYRVQMEQQQLVTGATRTLFSACGFDEADEVIEERHCWYESDPALRAEILAGWKQFDADLAAYVPTEIKERPPAEVTIALPALVIHAKGEITTSNMKEYGAALAKRLAEVRSIALVTDHDFSNAKAGAKLLREEIEKAKLVKAAMLEQTLTVGEAARMIDTWCEDMRVTALQLEKDVEREDLAKKAAMIAKAKSAYESHIEAMKVETGGPWIVLTPPNWPEAIKSKRSYASMQDALDTMLANAKSAASESARKIRAALAALDDEAKGYEHLFADRLTFISKPAEDVRALVRGRIAEHRTAEERRAAELAERERARIRQEEETRARAQAQREQQEREAAERRQREEAEAQQRRQEQEAAARAEQERQQQAPAVAAQPLQATPVARQEPAAVTDNVRPMPTRAPAPAAAPAGPPTLTLGEIKKRLAPLSIDDAGLTALGFPPAKQEGAAKLRHESTFHDICAAIAQHVVAVANGQRAVA